MSRFIESSGVQHGICSSCHLKYLVPSIVSIFNGMRHNPSGCLKKMLYIQEYFTKQILFCDS